MEGANGHDMRRAPPASATPHSPWHSPVPYLFGGLAAMLGLIAFALVILACSYWKLSGHLDGTQDEESDLEAGTGGDKMPVEFEEKILVIMAGEVKPTFLATPVSSQSSSFGDGGGKGNHTSAEDDAGNASKPQESSDQHNR